MTKAVERDDLQAILEALLFASGEPLKLDEIVETLAGHDKKQIRDALEELGDSLARDERGLRLERVAGGYQLTTAPQLAEHLRALFRYRNRKRLTPATLDVLTIVAYSQPVTSPEIQEVRGTDPSYALRVLQDRKLIKMIGRKQVVGRPMLYGTTREFLVHFGLDSLADLPPVEAYGTQVVPQQRLFESDELIEIEPLEGEEEAQDDRPSSDDPLIGAAAEAQDLAGTPEVGAPTA